MKLLFITFLFFSFSALAAPFGKVVLLRGEATYAGKKLTKGHLIQTNGTLKVGDKSIVQIKVEDYNSILTFGPKSEMKVSFKKGEFETSPFTLVNGAVRWLTKGKAKYKGGIQTRSTAMGVRGTDFLAIANSVFGEAEIICFSGKVLFSNKDKVGNQYYVSQRQWGGLGGRYGKYIQKPLDLPDAVVEQMNTVNKID